MATEKINKEIAIYESDSADCRVVGNTLFISGNLTVDSAGSLTRALLKKFRKIRAPIERVNLERLDDVDSAGVVALGYINNKLKAKFPAVKSSQTNETVKKKIELFSSETVLTTAGNEEPELAETVGQKALMFTRSYLYGFLILATNIFYYAFSDLFRKKTRREGEFANQSVLIGVNATFIIVIMSYAIGLVLAIQSASQLRSFGADIFIVDIVVIAIMSQLGPLITGVLVAGRSGSAIAAEIATMKVTSELDALTTMGLDPVRYVVVPKLYASLVTIPFLIILANVAGIAGGATAAYIELDITPEIFTNRMNHILSTKHLYTAFVKSQVYAGIIVLTGSFYGFRVERGAEGVGKVTTLAVVVSISLVILADSFMAVLFY